MRSNPGWDKVRDMSFRQARPPELVTAPADWSAFSVDLLEQRDPLFVELSDDAKAGTLVTINIVKRTLVYKLVERDEHVWLAELVSDKVAA